MRSNLSSRLLTAAVGFGAVMALAVPGSALASDHVRFKAHGTGVVAPAAVACPAGFTALSLTATGHANHLGRYDWASTECFNFTTFVTVDGRFTLTAANGDTLTGTYSGGAAPLPGGLAGFEDDAVITGGTGRFEEAGGRFHVSGIANVAAMTFEHRLSGTITRADDDGDDDEDDD
jgi:hypothetical protein